MSQNEDIHRHLKRRSITPLDALNLYGCQRLASRIKDLKYAGVSIHKEMVSRNGKRFARYYLDRGKKS